MNKSSALVGAPMLLLVLLQLLLVSASPIRYDQRQDGDTNVDARLQNFFVVLAPTNTAQLGSTGVSLLDLASKAVPLRLRPQGIVGVGAAADGLKQREEADPEQEQQDQEVKEAKSGRSVPMPVPLTLAAVAIPAAILQSPLAKLHPEVQALSVEEVLIARSPVVALRSPPGPTPIGAPTPAAAVPMLVAVPVPEVAPERPAAPPALLPMHPAAPTPLGDKPEPAAEAVAAAIAVPAAAIAAPDAIAPVVDIAAADEAAPSVVEVEAPAAPAIAAPDAIAPEIEIAAPASADAAPAPAATIEAAPPAVETNQVEPEPIIFQDVQVPKVHLIGTGIEECGPERVRNQEGVCVDEPARD